MLLKDVYKYQYITLCDSCRGSDFVFCYSTNISILWVHWDCYCQLCDDIAYHHDPFCKHKVLMTLAVDVCFQHLLLYL